MTHKQRPSPLSLIVKAPFFAGFLVFLFILGSSLLSLIEGFGTPLGFSAATRRVSTYALLALFVFLSVLVLTRYLSRND